MTSTLPTVSESVAQLDDAQKVKILRDALIPIMDSPNSSMYLELRKKAIEALEATK